MHQEFPKNKSVGFFFLPKRNKMHFCSFSKAFSPHTLTLLASHCCDVCLHASWQCCRQQSIVVFIAFFFGPNVRFFIFLKICESGIFAFSGSNMSLNPITPYIRWKICVHTFQKFLKKLKLGNFTRLMTFWLEKPRKRQKYDTKKTQSSHILEVAQLQNF